jgi:hypothetical protein
MKLFNSIIMFSVLFLFIASLKAQDTYKLEYKFEKGKTYRYQDLTKTDMTQEMMGKEMKIKSEGNIVNRLVVDDVTVNGNAVLLISADSMKVFSSTPMGDTTMILSELIGKRTKVVLSRLGKIENREIVDSVKITGRAAGAAQRESIQFPKLSDKAVKIGDTWTATTQDTVNQMGGKIAVTGNYEYTLLGQEKKDDRNCLKITYTGKTTTEGKAKMQGMEFFIDGSGKTSGTIYFDAKAGLVVYEETLNDSETNMALTGEQQMIIPITQATKSIRTLIK